MKKISALFFVVVFGLSVSQVVASNPVKNQNQNQARVRICQAREGSIHKRTEKIMNMANAMVENFEVMSQRVRDYYDTKDLTVSNYGNLVADVQTNKEAVLVSLSQARAEASLFSCTGNDPQQSLKDFRKYMLEVNTALKDHRTSVKDLIVAVRTSASLDE